MSTEIDYLDPNNVFTLNKTFEAWSSGTRVTQILEVLDDNVLARIQSIQVVIPLDSLTLRRERTGTAPQYNSKARRKLRKQVLKDAPMLGEVKREN